STLKGTPVAQAGAGDEPKAFTPLPPPRIGDPPHKTESLTFPAPKPPPLPPIGPVYPPPQDLGTRTLPAPADSQNQGAGPHQLINTTQASVAFKIDQVGPSGVGKVEIYMTPDKGNSWHPLREVADKNSPIEIKLPGDGFYGLRVVVSNGNGFGGRAPVK